MQRLCVFLRGLRRLVQQRGFDGRPTGTRLFQQNACRPSRRVFLLTKKRRRRSRREGQRASGAYSVRIAHDTKVCGALTLHYNRGTIVTSSSSARTSMLACVIARGLYAVMLGDLVMRYSAPSVESHFGRLDRVSRCVE
jgi:hypothetical protein